MTDYTLVDENPYYFNCGHYPEWVVKPDPAGKFGTEAEAQARADELNAVARRRWEAFLATP